MESRFLGKALALLLMISLAKADIVSDSTNYTWYVAAVGDSIVEGHPNYHSSQHTGPSGNVNYDIGTNFIQYATNQVTLTNLGVGGYVFRDINLTTLDVALTLKPKYVFIHCGVNDVNNGWSWADILTNLNAISSKCVSSNALILLDEIFPWTAGSDGNASTIRTYNENLSQWTATNDIAFLLTSHDEFGTNRVSTSQLDDLKPEYNEDGVHITDTGYDKWVELVFNRLSELSEIKNAVIAGNVVVSGNAIIQ